MHAKLCPIPLLLLLLLLLPAACSRAPQTPADPGVDLSDPNVGGGAGQDTGPQTPVPTPTETREASPRLDATMAATAVFPEATPSPTADDRPPTAAPTSDEGGQGTATTEATVTPEATPDAATPDAATATPTPGGERIHVVQPDENLYRIGLLYGLSWVAIAEYNGITNPDAITTGQELRIPPSPTPSPTATLAAATDDQQPATTQRGSEKRVAADVSALVARGNGGAKEPPSADEAGVTATAQPASASDEPTSAVIRGPSSVVAVAPGDTLYAIGRRYGVSWDQIAEANGLSTPNHILAGQVLKIPADVPGPTPEFGHWVHRGETVSAVARQYGLSAGELAAANNLAAPFTIYPGQTLVIPSDD